MYIYDDSYKLGPHHRLSLGFRKVQISLRIEIADLWDVKQCCLVMGTNILEELAS
jgi:hypothetical protein